MSRLLTPDQARAVDCLSGDVAVKAGAGSGKTRVLSYRFSNAMAAHEGWNPAGADEILTITFTNKAAGEIAERVRRVVTEELSAQEGRRVGEAWISTIHSLCGRLVRRHLLEAGVEPQFGLADEVTTVSLQEEAFERAAARLYAADPGVTRALEVFSVDTLRARVIACHENARSLGLDPRSIEVPSGADEIEEWLNRLHSRADELGAALACAKQTPSVVAKAERLAEWRGELGACVLGNDDACLRLRQTCAAYDIQRPPEDAKECHRALKEELDSVMSAANAAAESELLAGLQRLMRSFAEEYSAVKSERGVLDFDDLQEKAVKLLEGDPAIARRYREGFRLIMVDEFQDTNDLQMRVLAPLRNDNICVVGDARQSVYGFRYADVEIFERESKAMARPPIELKQNFRSHPDVLNFINACFRQEHLFGDSFMELEPGRKDEDVPAYLGSDPRIRCLFIGTDEAKKSDGIALEAARVADEVTGLLASGARGSDIAILVRAATHVAAFAEALESSDIPVLLNAGVGLMDAPEVAEVAQLLRAIAVPTDDQELLAVLSGRMVNVSDDALLCVSRASGSRALWYGLESVVSGEWKCALSDEDREALSVAHANLDRLGSMQGAVPLPDLVISACQAFDYDITLHATGPSGIRAWANVAKIARLAEAFEAAESNDVAEFVEHLKKCREARSDKAAPAEAGHEAVQLMTVHAAKGLEFPVVFVVDLAVRQAHDMPGVLVAKVEQGSGEVPVVGVRLPEECGRAETAAFKRMSRIRREREIEEEKRCLYVACTRAQELLYLSGCTQLETSADECRGLIDWIRMALGDMPDGAIDVGGVAVRVEHLAAQPVEREPLQPPVNREPGGYAPPLFTGPGELSPPPPPRAVSYSALHLYTACPLAFHARYVLGLGSLREAEANSAVDFGSAAHIALQTAAGEAVTAERVRALVAKFNLSPDEERRLTGIGSRFADSELSRRLRDSERTAYEEPLYVALTPGTALVGAMDVVAWHGLSALIVDYKTGKAPGPSDRRRQEGYELQARCYALAALRAGAESVEVAFAFVEHDAVQSFEFGRGDEMLLHEGLIRLLNRIESEPITHLAEYDAELCSGCSALDGICSIQTPAWAR